MTDRELLELAADAIRLPPLKFIGSFVGYWDHSREGKGIGCNVPWNPLTDDGDALRLACSLSMTVVVDAESREATAVFYGGKLATEPCRNATEAPKAARRAIVRCAAMAAEALEELASVRKLPAN